VSHQIGRITQANRQHSSSVESIQQALQEIRGITDRNVRGVEDTRRATDGLREQTRSLTTIADRLAKARPNGAAGQRRRE
jgi:methyl-accepting chemotaxis protein